MGDGQVTCPCKDLEGCTKAGRTHDLLPKRLKSYLKVPEALKGKGCSASDSDASAIGGGSQKAQTSSDGIAAQNKVGRDILYCYPFADSAVQKKRAKLYVGTNFAKEQHLTEGQSEGEGESKTCKGKDHSEA